MASRVLRTTILTVSDRASAGIYEDRSGPAITDLVTRILDVEIVESAIVPDDRETISAQLRVWTDEMDVDLVLTTGGTGFAPRDVTPEATSDVIEREAPGLSEAMRAASREITPHGMLSRGISGIRGRTLIINLPGSPKAATENLNVVLRVLPHAIALLRDESSDEAAHHYHHRSVA